MQTGLSNTHVKIRGKAPSVKACNAMQCRAPNLRRYTKAESETNETQALYENIIGDIEFVWSAFKQPELSIWKYYV